MGKSDDIIEWLRTPMKQTPMVQCERCGGSGKYFQMNPDCNNCAEYHEVDNQSHCLGVNKDGSCVVPSTCPTCSGSGWVVQEVEG